MVMHEIILRGQDARPGPLILERIEPNFISAVLSDLAETDGLGIVAATACAPINGTPLQGQTLYGSSSLLKLYQPNHRTYHMALFEVCCEQTFYQPRIDPRRIESAGMVIRHLKDGTLVEGWMKSKKREVGWMQLDPKYQQDTLDPDPSRRPVLSSGVPELDQLLPMTKMSTDQVEESVIPLFPAPRALCDALGQTILYGFIPTSSSQAKETVDVTPLPDDFIQGHIANYLTSGGIRTMLMANYTFTTDDVQDSSLAVGNSAYRDLLSFLRQLTFEFEAFSDDNPTFFNLLQQITLEVAYDDGGGTYPAQAGDLLRAASELLVQHTATDSVKMPIQWPAIDGTLAGQIKTAVSATLTRRIADARPQEGRFADSTPIRQYHLRGFVRIRDEEGDCPPEIWWSAPSEAFQIAPWWDKNPKIAPIPVALPSIKDFKGLKPDVAFAVPKELQSVLEGLSLDGLMKGNVPGGSIDIDWICSFSIPIITLCAFIVLNIFLQLLNIVFQWLLFIKICIPIPKPK